MQDSGDRKKAPIYRVWQDSEIRSCLTKSISTVKVDACHHAFSAFGQDILWALLDSGIDAKHPHFDQRIDKCLSKDFSGEKGDPLEDKFGHGTHVAGIIAGSWKPAVKRSVVATEVAIEQAEQTEVRLEEPACISGIAPSAKLVSLKVLNASGVGRVSSVLLAIEEIQNINKYGRSLRIHGANMSIGYDFNPRWTPGKRRDKSAVTWAFASLVACR